MSSESKSRFYCNFCCTSNTAAAEGFAITHLIILGIAECFMSYGIGSTGISNISWHTAFWPMFGFFTYWFILSILVVIGTNGHQNHGLLLVSTVLGWLGILGFAAYLFLSYFVSYGYNNYYIGQSVHFETLKISLGCIWLLISFWYVLCIYGAMLEARETNTPGIVDGPSGVEKGQPGQPGTEIITVPSIPAQGQQVYLTPGSLGVEMENPGKPTFEPSDPPPSYYELFQANDIAINHI